MKRYWFAALVLTAYSSAASAQITSADDLRRSLGISSASSGGPSRGIRGAGSRVISEPTQQPTQPAQTAPQTSRVAVSRPMATSHPDAETNTPPRGAASVPIQFDMNSVQITPAAAKQIDEIGKALASPEFAIVHFRIEGHTDTVGRADANKSLSERRAAAVANYIVQHFGIDASRLVPVGMGEDGLLVPTGPGVDEPRNRRVQIVNLGS